MENGGSICRNCIVFRYIKVNIGPIKINLMAKSILQSNSVKPKLIDMASIDYIISAIIIYNASANIWLSFSIIICKSQPHMLILFRSIHALYNALINNIRFPTTPFLGGK